MAISSDNIYGRTFNAIGYFRMQDADGSEIRYWEPDPPAGMSEGEAENLRKRLRYKNYRGFQMRRAKQQNWEAVKGLDEYLRKNRSLPENVETSLVQFRKNVCCCSSHALIREHENGAFEFMGTKTCKHKMCFVCNARRAKELRRKYRMLFEKNTDLVKNYDFFHLTLTVPHSEEGGFRGKRWYASELMEMFNRMRKKDWWKARVYAGEFGVECTKGSNGLHLHIHSLVLARKSKQSRNELHRLVLQSWNGLTSGATKRAQFTEKDVEDIKKGNALLTDADVAVLNPTGATLIGLESLFMRSETQKKGYRYCERARCWKKYVAPSDGLERFMGGIMECLKYHFEPMCLNGEGDRIDFDLASEIIANIKGKPLYRKYGAFHCGRHNSHPDAKMLNLNESPQAEIEEVLAETGEAEILNPITLVRAERDDYRYLIVPFTKVRFCPHRNYLPIVAWNAEKHVLQRGITLGIALRELVNFHVLRNLPQGYAIPARRVA